jgi:hypothetical protein
LDNIFRDNLFSAWNQVDLGSSTASEDWLTEALPLLQVFADFSQGDLLLPFLLLLLLLLRSKTTKHGLRYICDNTYRYTISTDVETGYDGRVLSTSLITFPW